MDDDPPEPKSQGSLTRTLVLSFKDTKQQNSFLTELMSIQTDQANYSLFIQHKTCCKIIIIGKEQDEMDEFEYRVNKIIDTISHEKNNWWKWY